MRRSNFLVQKSCAAAIGFFLASQLVLADDIEIDLGAATPAPKSAASSASVSKASTSSSSVSSEPTQNMGSAGENTATSEGSASGSPQISQIQVTSEDAGTRVAIEGTSLPKPSLQKLSSRKVLLKFNKTHLAIPGKLNEDNAVVKDIRSSMHSKTAWVVLDLTGVKKWKLEKTDSGYALLLNVNQNSTEAPQETSSAPLLNAPENNDAKGLFSRLIDASLKPTDNGVKLVLTSDSPSKYTVRKLSQPEKIIVHFYNTKLDVADKTRRFKAADAALEKGGLLSLEFRQIGPAFSPIAEAMLTVLPGTIDQIDRDLNQIVITLTAPPPTAPKVAEKKGNLNKLISMDLQGADLNAVVKMLANEGGFDLDLVSPIAGTVNQKYKDVPLKTVLGDLLGPGNYAYEVQGNTLRIGSQATLSSTKAILPHVTDLIAPSGGMSPQQFDTLVHPLLLPGNASTVEFDTVRNMIILTGTPSDIEDYKRAIRDLKLDESTESNRITRVVKLNYADPGKLSTILSAYLTPVGKIQVDTTNYQLVIWETAANMGTLLELINELDRKPPQVLIESNIVEVNNEADLNLGVAWTLNKATGDPTVSGVSGTGSLTSFGQINFGTVKAGIDVNAEIEALETHKKAKIVSRPRIATTNGTPAEINEIENITYTQQQVVPSTVGPPLITTTFLQLPLPIDLKVTPRISDDGTITTQIVASITAQTAVVQGGSAGAIAPPQTSVQTATTTINTKNGETIVIGGLVRESVSETVNGLPILSSIPIIGTLFQEKSRVNQKEELVIFITPTLLED